MSKEKEGKSSTPLVLQAIVVALMLTFVVALSAWKATSLDKLHAPCRKACMAMGHSVSEYSPCSCDLTTQLVLP